MGANFTAIEIGLSALRSFKDAQNVIGNNISNVSTPGYVRREAVFQPVGAAGDRTGGGVNVTAVRRLCDGFAQAQSRVATGAARKEELLRDTAVEAEQYLNPLTEGSLYERFGTFWNSLQALSNSPADGGLRQSALAGAGNVAQAVNDLSDNYAAMKVRLGQAADGAVTDLNSRLKEVAALNHQIQAAEACGTQANTLRDQRDQAVSAIAGSLDVDINEQADGLHLSCGGQMLVSGASASAVSVSLEGVSAQEFKFRLSPGQEIKPLSGKLAGMQESLAEIETLSGEVKKISASLASSAPGTLNAIHRAGYTLAGAPSGEDLFNFDSAGRLRVNPNIAGDASQLAAAQTPNPGDGSNAAALAAALKAPQLADVSPADFISSLASALGTKTAELKKSADRLDLVESAALTRVDSSSGVSLDEETAKLLELQNSYATVAKFISSANEMMDQLLAIIR